MGVTAPSTARARRTPSARPQCVIPNGTLDDEQWGDTCPDCRSVFGAHLRLSAAPALSHQQILDRDGSVDRALALQRQIHGGDRHAGATAAPTRRGKRA